MRERNHPKESTFSWRSYPPLAAENNKAPLQEETLADPSRRQVLKGIVAGFVALKTGMDLTKTAMDVDAMKSREDIRPRSGSTTFITRETREEFKNSCTLIYRGFNVDVIDTTGLSLSPYLLRYGQVAAVDYGNLDFDINTIQKQTIDFCKEYDIQNVNIFGKSMGGMVGLEMVSALSDENIHIESLIFDSSPASRKGVIGAEDTDTYFINAYNTLARMDFVSYGGDKTRAFVENKVGEIMHKRDPRIELTKYKSDNQLPSDILMQQIGFIGSFEVTDTMAHLLQNVPVAYLGSDNGSHDNTVDIMHSFEEFKDTLRGCNVQLYPLNGVSHASSERFPQVYGPTIIQFRKDSRLPLAQ